MKVRILRVPPSRILEGVDLGPYRFDTGHLYELELHVAKVLVVWNYAEYVWDSDPTLRSDQQFT